MKNIVVPKEKLVATLIENRDKHQTEFNELNHKYHAALRAAFEDKVDLIKSGANMSAEDHYIRDIDVPEDHTADYTRAIEMLDWDEGDTVELSEGEFRRYVQDNWEWSGKFAGTKSNYGI